MRSLQLVLALFGVAVPAAAEPVPASWSAAVGALSVRQEPDDATGVPARTRTFSTAAMDATGGFEVGLAEIRASFDARGGTAGLKGDRYGDAVVGLDGKWTGALSKVTLGLRGGRSIEESDGMSLSLGDQLGLAFIAPEERALSRRAEGNLGYERAWSPRFATRVFAQTSVYEREAIVRQQNYEIAFDRIVDAAWRLSLAYAGSVYRYGDVEEPSVYSGPDVISRHELGPTTELEVRGGVRTSREEPTSRTESGRVTLKHAPPERTLEVLAARTIAQRPAGAGADLGDVMRGAWTERIDVATSFRASAADELAKPLGDDDLPERRTLRVEAGLVWGFGPAVVARPARSRWELGLGATHEEARSAGAHAKRETLQTSLSAAF